MSTRADFYIFERSRTLTITRSATLNCTVAFTNRTIVPGGPLPYTVISNCSVSGIGSPSVEQRPGYILAYGITTSGGFQEVGTLNMLSADFSAVSVDVPPGTDDSDIFKWATFTFSVSVSIATTGTFQDIMPIGPGVAGTQVFEVVPPSGTVTQTLTIGSATTTTTFLNPAASWNARIAGGIGAARPGAYGMYGASFALNAFSHGLTSYAYYDVTSPVPGTIRTGRFNIGTPVSGSAAVTISGTGMVTPDALSVYSSPFGSCGSGSLTVSAATLDHAYSGSYSDTFDLRHTFSVQGTLKDLDGNLNTTPKDVNLYFWGGNPTYGEQAKPFKIPGVTGTFTYPVTVGGRQQTARFSDGTTIYSDVRNNYPLAPDGATSVIVGANTGQGTPLLTLADDPGPAYSAFFLNLPHKAGGWRVKQLASLKLFSSPWPVNAPGATALEKWSASTGSTLATSGTAGAYLRFTALANGTISYAFNVTQSNPAPLIPYRFIKIRFRSVGAANKPLEISIYNRVTFQGLVVKKTFVSGADGDFVEGVLDLREDNIERFFPGGQIGDQANVSYLRNGNLYAFGALWVLKSPTAATFEIQEITGFRRNADSSLISVLMPHVGTRYLEDPFLQSEVIGSGVRSFHGTTDGMITLSQNLYNVAPSSLDVIGARINNSRWPAWTVETVQPVRGDKPPRNVQAAYALNPSDLTDGEAYTGWLAGGGLYADGTTTLDKPVPSAGYVIPLQATIGLLITYPGAGTPFVQGAGGVLSSGTYGSTTPLPYKAIVKRQVVGVLTGGEGSTVTATVMPGGAPAGQGEATDDTGYASTRSPHVPQGAKAIITATPEGAPVVFPASGGSDSKLTVGTATAGLSNGFNFDAAYTTASGGIIGRGRIWAMFSTKPVLPARSPRNINTRQGSFYGSPVIRGFDRRGRVQWRRTSGAQVNLFDTWEVEAFVSSPDTAARESDAEPWPWYENRDSSLHLLYTRETYAPDAEDGDAPTTTAVRAAVSHDDGKTWDESAVATNARHPYALAEEGSAGGVLRAWFVPDAGTEDEEEVTGTIQGTYQASGDASPSSMFTFQFKDDSDALVDLTVKDDNFALTPDVRSQKRINLFVLIADEEDPSIWSSADDGKTWVRATL